MLIKKLNVKNFRLLEDVSISLDKRVTLIVGCNNSGKTSLTEVFYKFLSGDGNRFAFEDFSITSYEKFKQSLELWKQLKAAHKKQDEPEIEIKDAEFRASIPVITAQIHI